MKKLCLVALFMVLVVPSAYAMHMDEDIAITIKLRGFDCGGNKVHNITETRDGAGNQITEATCPNGIRYRIVVTPNGRLRVQPLN